MAGQYHYQTHNAYVSVDFYTLITIAVIPLLNGNFLDLPHSVAFINSRLCLKKFTLYLQPYSCATGGISN